MYTLYLAGIGEVSVPRKSVKHIGHKIYLLGYDRRRQSIYLVVDRIDIPKGQPEECGYCHIISYSHGNTVTKCNIYQALR